MTWEPYASAERVFWVVDNGSSHRGQKAIDRLAEQFSNAVMVHTPVHAFWLNQVEIYFSIIQRKVLSPNDFDDLDEVTTQIGGFEIRYNQNARPFKWKFTTADLNELLTQIGGFEIRYNRNARPFKWKFTTADLNELLTRIDRHRPPTADPETARTA